MVGNIIFGFQELSFYNNLKNLNNILKFCAWLLLFIY